MFQVTNSTLNEQIYPADITEDVLNRVAGINIILMPRAICVAGFDADRKLIATKYHDYQQDLNNWIIDFYEHRFLNDELLKAADKVTAVFVASDRNMPVPAELYTQQDAEQWMRSIHFVEEDEVINDYQLTDSGIHYLYAWPQAMGRLIKRYFADAAILPLATYQLNDDEDAAYCCLTNGMAYATLYKDSKLQWHQAFKYANAEDIAYQLMHAHKKFDTEPKSMNLQCTTVCELLSGVVNELQAYFPNLKDGTAKVQTDNQNMVSTIFLLQQLYACV